MTKIENVILQEGTTQLRITEVKGLEEKQKTLIKINGNVDSVLNFLTKRKPSDKPEVGNLINELTSHVIINREDMVISLTFNESNPYGVDTVTGKLENHPDFLKWKINTGEGWSHQQLAEFCKMNRSSFSDPNLAMTLFKELKDIRIKTEKELENSNDNKGSQRVLLSQKVISSNIPGLFVLNVPVFKGQEKKTFEVEVYVDPSSFMVTLVSPSANDIVSAFVDSIIDEQKKAIQEICEQIVIIES